MRKQQKPTPMDMEHVTILEQLKKEHDDLRALILEVDTCEVRERKSRLAQIARALVPHARAEEKTLYALLRLRSQSQKNYGLEIVNEGYEEHRAVDDLLANLKKISANNERWMPLFTVFKANLLHHIHKEEQQLWKQAENLFTLAEQQDLLRGYVVLKEKYSQELPDQKNIREREPSSEVAAMV